MSSAASALTESSPTELVLWCVSTRHCASCVELKSCGFDRERVIESVPSGPPPSASSDLVVSRGDALASALAASSFSAAATAWTFFTALDHLPNVFFAGCAGESSASSRDGVVMIDVTFSSKSRSLLLVLSASLFACCRNTRAKRILLISRACSVSSSRIACSLCACSVSTLSCRVCIFSAS